MGNWLNKTLKKWWPRYCRGFLASLPEHGRSDWDRQKATSLPLKNAVTQSCRWPCWGVQSLAIFYLEYLLFCSYRRLNQGLFFLRHNKSWHNIVPKLKGINHIHREISSRVGSWFWRSGCPLSGNVMLVFIYNRRSSLSVTWPSVFTLTLLRVFFCKPEAHTQAKEIFTAVQQIAFLRWEAN